MSKLGNSNTERIAGGFSLLKISHVWLSSSLVHIFQCQYLNTIKNFFAISSPNVHPIKGDRQSVPNCGQYIENKLCGGYNKRFS